MSDSAKTESGQEASTQSFFNWKAATLERRKPYLETVSVDFGALCPPIAKQLATVAPDKDFRPLDELAEALTLCFIQGVLSESEIDRARKRLMKKVVAVINSKP